MLGAKCQSSHAHVEANVAEAVLQYAIVPVGRCYMSDGKQTALTLVEQGSDM